MRMEINRESGFGGAWKGGLLGQDLPSMCPFTAPLCFDVQAQRA